MLYGTPAATLDVLQRAQNNLASVVCQRGEWTNARPLLRSLDWLLVKHRVTYKMATLTFKTMSSSTSAYLNALIQTAVPVRPLRSSDAPLLTVPKTRTEFAHPSFLSRLRTLGTHYHPTLGPAVLWTPSNDTSRPIFSDSLNLTPPAPLYLRTLWRYTNAVIIIKPLPPIMCCC